MRFSKLIKEVNKKYGVSVVQTERSIILSGEMDSWEDIVNVGYLFVDPEKKRYVVNEIRLRNHNEEPMHLPAITDDSLEGKEVDVLVIGGGIIGATILRELSKYQLKSLLIEKEADLALGASGANDGMIHPGIDLKPGTLKAKYCLKGNKMYEALSRELDFDFQRCGQYIVFGSKSDRALSFYLKHKAKILGIKGFKVLSKKELISREPETEPWAEGAVYLSDTGIISPYQAVIAFTENALNNGAEIALETACLGFILEEGKIIGVKTNRGLIRPKIIINAAGVFADKIAEFADDKYFSIHPRKGTDLILDSKVKHLVNTIISRFPKISQRHSHTKGGAIISTVDGNLLIGPDAEEVPDRENNATTKASLERVINKHRGVIPKIKASDVIAYFSGVRAATYEEDFIIEKSKKVKNLFHVAGIQSPGLTAAPAIAVDIVGMALDYLRPNYKIDLNLAFNPYRKRIPRLALLPPEERAELIKDDPDYGQIVCRCEKVSLGEIKAAIHSQLPATSIDALKRRVRTGMGRCQGGFCTPQLLKILSEELKIDFLKVKKRGSNTEIGLYQTKGTEGEDDDRL
ncbi:MAG: NAD(P)/FAD-dependent oxidoreductase [Acholeplasmataceae bacterium]|nr:NAD(P)/FAD-dependent oxidoreductase [Acholeplasmataceae bacterium]